MQQSVPQKFAIRVEIDPNDQDTQDEQEKAVTSAKTYQRDPQREKGRQTVYLDPELRRWIKHHAIDEDKDISDIILIAVREYRIRVERRG